MAEPKYGVKGIHDVIGVMYEVDGREIFVMYTDTIKSDDEWNIKDAKTGEVITDVSIVDLLNEILPKTK